MRIVRTAFAFVLALGVTGCAASPAFVANDRIEIRQPVDLAVVGEPFLLDWTDDGAAPDHYAIFVDRDPIGPGETIDSLADDACRQRDGCPDDQYLADRGIYLTSDTELLVPRLVPLGGAGAADPRPIHRATIVLIDDGVRRGEAAWSIEFRESS